MDIKLQKLNDDQVKIDEMVQIDEINEISGNDEEDSKITNINYMYQTSTKL